jgi:hypothetical protein
VNVCVANESLFLIDEAGRCEGSIIPHIRVRIPKKAPNLAGFESCGTFESKDNDVTQFSDKKIQLEPYRRR